MKMKRNMVEDKSRSTYTSVEKWNNGAQDKKAQADTDKVEYHTPKHGNENE